MAITYIGGAIDVINNWGTADLSVAVPGTYAADDFAFAFLGADENSSTVSFDTTGWTLEEQGSTASGRDRTWGLWYRRLTSGSETDVTVSNSGASEEGALSVVVFRGVDTTTALDTAIVGATLNDNDVNVAFDSITTATDAAAIVLFRHYTHDGVSAFGSPPTGYTFAITDNSQGMANMSVTYDLDVGTAGSKSPGSPSHTQGNSNSDQTSFVAALRPATGAGDVDSLVLPRRPAHLLMAH
jgi:hypothetical protein